jgi:C-5 cytosine-specific DNA methylase
MTGATMLEDEPPLTAGHCPVDRPVMAHATERRMRVLSICTGMGLLDRAFMDAGFDVVPGCEIDPQKRAMYEVLCAGSDYMGPFQPTHLVHDLADLPAALSGRNYCAPHFDGIIGGPSCQSHSKLRAIRDPKFPDLTPLVQSLLTCVNPGWFMFENVVPIDIPGAVHTRCNAMHYYQPHQSRSRWFTHSPNIKPPQPVYRGNVDDLMAYSVVAGRIYGPKRGAKLQGYPAAADLPFPCVQLQHGLADAVPYPLALAWAESIKRHNVRGNAGAVGDSR